MRNILKSKTNLENHHSVEQRVAFVDELFDGDIALGVTIKCGDQYRTTSVILKRDSAEAIQEMLRDVLYIKEEKRGKTK